MCAAFSLLFLVWPAVSSKPIFDFRLPIFDLKSSRPSAIANQKSPIKNRQLYETPVQDQALVLQPPTLVGLSHTSGPVLSIVRIEGTGFSLTASENVVTVGGTVAPSRTISTTQIEFIVPDELREGQVNITVTSRGQGSNPLIYSVTPPVVPDVLTKLGYNLDFSTTTHLGAPLKRGEFRVRAASGGDLVFPGEETANRGLFPTQFFGGVGVPSFAIGTSVARGSIYATPIPGRSGVVKDTPIPDLPSSSPRPLVSATTNGFVTLSSGAVNFTALPPGSGTPLYTPVFTPNPNFNTQLPIGPSNSLLLPGPRMETYDAFAALGMGTVNATSLPPEAGVAVAPPIPEKNPDFSITPNRSGSPLPFGDGTFITTSTGVVKVAGSAATFIPFPIGSGQPVGTVIPDCNPNFNPNFPTAGFAQGEPIPFRSTMLVAVRNGLVSITPTATQFAAVPAGAGRVICQPVCQINPNFNFVAASGAPFDEVRLFLPTTLLATENGLVDIESTGIGFTPVPAGAGRVISPPVFAINPDFNPFFSIAPTGSSRPFLSTIFLATTNGLVSIANDVANFIAVPADAGQVISPPVFGLNPNFNPSFNPSAPSGSPLPFAREILLGTTNGVVSILNNVPTFITFPLGTGMPVGAPLPVTTPGIGTEIFVPVTNGLVRITSGFAMLIPLPVGAGRVLGPPLINSNGHLFVSVANGLVQFVGTATLFFPVPQNAGEVISIPVRDPSDSSGTRFIVTTANGFAVVTSGPGGAVNFISLPAGAGQNIAPRVLTCLLPPVNQPPIAQAGPDRTATVGSPVTFDGSASIDPDGTIVAYQWSFGDGGVGSGSMVSHVYNTSGTFTVTLTVTDNEGATATDTALVTVQSAPAILDVMPTSLTFNAVVGQGNPASQAITVRNTGSGSLTFSITSSDVTLVTTSVSSGTLSGGQSTSVQVFATNPNVAGTRTATLTVTAPGAQNSPQSVLVTVITTQAAILNVSPTSLTFNTGVGQGNPAAQTITVQNTGSGSLTFSINTSDATLVTTSPSTATLSGGQSTNVQVFVTNPNVAGTRTATLTVTAPGAQNSPQSVLVTVITTQAAILNVSPTSLTFNTVVGQGNPAAQTITVQNAGSGSLNFSISSSDATLVTTSPTGGTLSGGQSTSIQVFATNPNVAGTRTATLTISAPGAQNSPQSVLVTVITTQAAILNVSPTSLTFTTVVGQGNPASQTITVQNSGGGSFNFSINTSDATLVTASPSSGTLFGGQSTTVQVFATNPNVAGTRTATLTINAPGAQNSPQSVLVTIITTQPAILNVSPTSLTFNAVVGQGNPASQTFTVQNSGGGSFNFSISSSDVTLVTTSPSGGTLSGGQSTNVQVFATNPNVAGTRTATLTISAPGAQNSPQSVLVTVITTQPAILNVSPASLTFNAVVGQGNPAAQAVTVQNSGGSSFSFNITSSDGTLVTTSPSTATLSGGQSTNVQVFVTNPNVAGTRTATLTVNAPGAQNSPRSVSITVITTQPAILDATPASLTFNTVVGQGNPAPQTVVVQNSGGGSFNFSVTSSDNTLVTTAPSSGTLSGGQSTNVQVFVTNPNVAGTRTATLTVSAPGAQNSPRFVSVTVNTASPPTLAVTPTSLTFNAVVGQGNPAQQSVTVQNSGGGSFNFSITSSDVTLVNTSPSNGTLSGGQSTNVQVIVTNPNVAGTRTATLTVTAPGAQNSPRSVSITVNTAPPPPMANLSVTKSDAPDPVTVGQNLTYTINVTNGGPDPATGVVLTDTLPGNVTFVSANSSQGSCTRVGVTVTCNLGGLANGASASATIIVTPNQAGTITNRAEVQANEADPNSANNTAQVTTTVQAAPTPDIDVQPSSWNYGTVSVGNTADKDFVVRNTGTAPLNVSAVSLTGTNAGEFSIQSGGGSFTLAPSGTRTVTVRFAPASAGNKAATLRFTSDDPNENPKDVSLSGRGTGTVGQLALVASGDVTLLQGLPTAGAIAGAIQINGNAREVAVAPNGEFAIAVTDGSRVAVVVGPASGSPQATSFEMGGPPVGVAIGANSTFAVVLVNTTPTSLVPILGLPNAPMVGEPVFLSAVGFGAQDIALTSSGTAVATATSIGGVVVVDSFGTSTAPTVRGTVRTGTNPSGVAVSRDGSTAFVVNRSNNNIVVVTGIGPGGRPQMGPIITTGVGTSPRAIAISPDGSMAVVTNEGSNSASIFTVGSSTLTFVKTVTVGSRPGGVSISSDGNTAIVANSGDQTVSVITSLRTNAMVTATIGPSSTQLRTEADREQSLAFIP
jgi:hypothetical protein